MLRQTRTAFLALGLIFHTSLSQCKQSTIVRDIAIIGGGASGTFSAVRLRDEGKSVILIEKDNILGGHVNTYQDLATKQTVDYGVVIFHNQQVVKDYFGRLNVSWTMEAPSFSASVPKYLDGKTGKQTNYTSPDPTAALLAYAQQLSKYVQLELGFFLPDPVPGDLLLPFGQFLTKYPDIGNATYTIFTYGQGLGDFLHQPTLYVFKNFGLDILQDMSSGFLVTTSHNNYEIYDHAAEFLGPDVLLSSRVVSTRQRDQDGIELDVQTPSGSQTVKGRKLLVAIPQKVDNMRPLALDSRESTLFSRFANTGYYTSLVNNTGLPPNFTSYSVGSDTPYNLPKLPGVYSVSATAIQGVFDVKYGSPKGLSDSEVQCAIVTYIKKLQANGFAGNVSRKPGFVRFDSHTPFELTVSPEQIANGFYRDLYALQGYRNTWYTGAAFHTQNSAMLWNFTDSYVLPGLLK